VVEVKVFETPRMSPLAFARESCFSGADAMQSDGNPPDSKRGLVETAKRFRCLSKSRIKWTHAGIEYNVAVE